MWYLSKYLLYYTHTSCNDKMPYPVENFHLKKLGGKKHMNPKESKSKVTKRSEPISVN